MLLYLLYKFARAGIKIVPRPICVWVGKRLADICFIFDTSARRAVISNLAHVLARTGGETETRRGRQGIARLARETFENFAVHIIDFLRIDRVGDDIESGLLRVEGFERFRDALGRGRGVISVTAHIGNWEMGAAAAARMGMPLSAVTLRMPDKKLEEFFSRLRASGGIRPIPSGHAARGCFQVIKRGEMLAFVADRNIDGSGHPVPFFGSEVGMPRGPAEIAARTGAPVIPAFCIQETASHFRLVVEEPIVVDAALPDKEKVDAVMKEMAARFEEYVTRYPSQWFAFGRIWS